MRWWEVLAMLLAVALLLVEGFRNLGPGRRWKGKEGSESPRRQQHPPRQQRLLGWLGLFIVCLVCIGGVLSSVGRLVFSPELGVVMVQGGPVTAWLLRLLPLGSSLAAGLAWCASHARCNARGGKRHEAGGRKYPQWWPIVLEYLPWWPMVLAAVLGGWAAFQVQLLGQDDMGPVHIYSYDLWWPPLLLWYGFCLAGCFLGLLRILEPISQTCRREIPHWVVAMLLFAFTLLMARYWILPAIRPEDGSYPPGLLWIFRIGLLLSVPTSIGLTARLLLKPYEKPPHERMGWREHVINSPALPLLYAALGVVPAVARGLDRHWKTYPLDSRLLELWTLWHFLALVSLVFALYFFVLARLRKRGSSSRSDIPGFSRPGWLVAFILLFIFTIVSLSPAAPLLPLPSYLLGLQMAALLLAWCVLLEPNQRRGMKGMKGLKGLKELKDGCVETMGTLGGTLKSMRDKAAPGPASRGPVPPPGGGTPSTRMTDRVKALAVMGVRILVVALVFCALIELPNARRMVIQPFKVTHLELPAPSGDGTPTPTAQELGLELSDRLLNALNAQMLLSQPDVVLQPRVLRPQKANVPTQLISTSRSELRQRETSTLPAISTGSIGKSDEFSEELKLELGLIKVPVNLLTTPLREPLRLLLGGRVLQGSLQEERAGYTLLVKSSTGQSWSLFLERGKAPTLEEALPMLADQMALKILSEDPTWARMGLTGSWEAFESYRSGMEHWARFHEAQDYNALSQAIRDFKTAEHADPRFALATYHLGLALQLNGNADAAAQAFRDSVGTHPEFISGHVTRFLASSLGQPPFAHPVATPPPEAPAAGAKQPGSTSSLLRFVERLPHLERAQLYHGLCIHTLSSWEEHRRGAHPREELLAQAYFHCTQAQREYAQVPATLRAELDTETSRASVLDQLGTILVLDQMRREPPRSSEPLAPSRPHEQKGWFCASEDTYGEPLEPAGKVQSLSSWNPRLRVASRYYQRAAALTTDPEIRCDAAMLSFQMGNTERMESLEQDVAAHVNFAELHRADAEERYWKRQQVARTLVGPLFRLNCLLLSPEPDVLECSPPESDTFREVSRRRIVQALEESRKGSDAVADLFRPPGVPECGNPPEVKELFWLPEPDEIACGKPPGRNALLADAQRKIARYHEDTRQQLDSGHARALENHRAAFKLDPTNLDALVGFARAFWQWSYLSGSVGSTGPGPEWNHAAKEVRQVLEEKKFPAFPLEHDDRRTQAPPMNLEALIDFTRAFWQWSYLSTQVISRGPAPEWDTAADGVRKALEEARTRFAEAPPGHGNGRARETGNGLSRKRLTQVHAALGELHLAMNEPTKARLELEQAARFVDHRPCFEAIHWDLEMARQAERQTQRTPGVAHGPRRELLKRAMTACPELQEGSWEKARECRKGTRVAQRGSRPQPLALLP